MASRNACLAFIPLAQPNQHNEAELAIIHFFPLSIPYVLFSFLQQSPSLEHNQAITDDSVTQ